MSTLNPTDPARRPARGQRAPRVLVVDDEADLRELLELTLVGMGLDVDCAADLGEARRLLAEGRYALCLTDMRLPDGDGLALVAEIGAEHQDTPVAVITAFGSADGTSLTRARFPPPLLLPPFLIAFLLRRDCSM